jgi:hypothetical protein
MLIKALLQSVSHPLPIVCKFWAKMYRNLSCNRQYSIEIIKFTELELQAGCHIITEYWTKSFIQFCSLCQWTVSVSFLQWILFCLQHSFSAPLKFKTETEKF